MRLLNTYLVQIKQKLIKNNQALKKQNDKRIRLINIICEYLDKDTFMFDDFIKNSNVRNLINDVVNDDRIKNNIINSMDDLKKFSWTDLVTNVNNSAVEKKNKMLNCLKELLSYLNRNPIYFYYDLDKELSVFDNLSKDVVDLDSRHERMFIRLGLKDDEILRLRSFVSKQNMEVYRKKINNTMNKYEHIIPKPVGDAKTDCARLKPNRSSILLLKKVKESAVRRKAGQKGRQLSACRLRYGRCKTQKKLECRKEQDGPQDRAQEQENGKRADRVFDERATRKHKIHSAR